VRLSRSPTEKLGKHTPAQFRQLKCWKPKKEADFSIKLPIDAAVTGAYTGKHVDIADPIAENFIASPLRLYDENTTTLKANAHQPVIDFLMRAAREKTLSKNNRVPTGQKPLEFPIMQAVFPMVVASAAAFGELSPDERKVIHA